MLLGGTTKIFSKRYFPKRLVLAKADTASSRRSADFAEMKLALSFLYGILVVAVSVHCDARGHITRLASPRGFAVA